ncbi:MAG: hypothetical protein RLZZ501_1463 [Pseudomonadota bacterium]|jgi:hypothetical protein
MSKTRSALDGQSHARLPQMGSNRAFGLVFATVFGVVAALPLRDGGEPVWWAAGVAAAFALIALIYPRALKPLNFVWFLIGLGLHRVVSPLVMGLLFFVTVTPVGLLMRLSGKDPLRLKRDPTATSYWIERAPGPAADSMRRQF